MRTADRMTAREWAFPLGLDENKGFMEDARLWVKTGPVLVADNVAHYVNERNPAICLEDYPSLAPPWPVFWLEYPSSSGRQRRGVVVLDTTDEQDTPDSDHLDDDGTDHIPKLSASAKRHALLADGITEDDVRWVVTFIIFIEQDRRVWGPAGIMSLALDVGGQVLGNRWSMAPVTTLTDAVAHIRDGLEEPPDDFPTPSLDELKTMSREEGAELLPKLEEHVRQIDGYVARLHEQIKEWNKAVPVLEHLQQLDTKQNDPTWMIRAMAPAMQAVAFLHCKNVVLNVVTPDEKVQAKRRKRGAEPLVRYHTLRLDVPRRSGGGSPRKGDLDSSALHIVAGHFAHYGACCPSHPAHGLLFGRLSGVYWVPSHLRGDRTAGQVLTDFNLVAPEVT